MIELIGGWSKNKVLDHLDSLDYEKRLMYIMQLGESKENASAYEKLLIKLMKDGSDYQGRLALAGAQKVKSHQVILMGINHPKESIKVLSVKLLGKIGTDDEIVSVYPRLSKNCRKKLIPVLCQAERHEAAMKIFPLVYEEDGPSIAGKLLAVCNEQMVKEWLPKIGDFINNWSYLAKRYPKIVLEYLKTALAAGNVREKRFIWYGLFDGIEELCDLYPEEILNMGIQISPKSLVESYKFTTFLKACPDRIVELAEAANKEGFRYYDTLPEKLHTKKAYCSYETWIQLMKCIKENDYGIAIMLKAMPPSKRQVAFEAVYPEKERANIIFFGFFMEELPHRLRDQEAARIVGLRKIYEDPRELMAYMAYRDIDIARPFFEEKAKSSDPLERADALKYLGECTCYSRKGLQETLKFYTRFKNDQTAVQAGIVDGIAVFSKNHYTDEHVPLLKEIVDNIVQSIDISAAVNSGLHRITYSIIRDHIHHRESEIFKLGLYMLQQILKRWGYINFEYFESTPNGFEKILFEALYPAMKEAVKQERYQVVLSFAKTFKEKAYKLPLLQELLKECIEAPQQDTALRAASLWLSDPQTKEERVSELIHKDLSFIKSEKVLNYLHFHRQTLLDTFISGHVTGGRFLSNKTIYLLPVKNMFFRWLPRQQRSFAKELKEVASNPKYVLTMRQNAIDTLAHMPDIDLEEDLLFLLKDQPSKEILEAVLRAMLYIQEPEKAIHILLPYIEGDTARIAMYGMSSCLVRVSPLKVVPLLEELLKRQDLKLTCKKEIVRLLSRYDKKQSIKVFQEILAENPHHNLMIAIGQGAKNLLDQPGAWDILNQLLHHPNKEVVKSLLVMPTVSLSKENRRQYLKLILEITKNPDVLISQKAFTVALYLGDGNEALIADAAAENMMTLEDGKRWEAACDALISICEEEEVHSSILKIYSQFISQIAAHQETVKEQRDLPERQRLIALTDKLSKIDYKKRMTLLALYKKAADIVSSEESLRGLAAKLYINGINWGLIEDVRAGLECAGAILEEQPYLAETIFNVTIENVQEMLRSKCSISEQCLIEMLTELIKLEHTGAKYIALAVLKAVGDITKWQSECITLLEGFRKQPDIMVRIKALYIFSYKEG